MAGTFGTVIKFREHGSETMAPGASDSIVTIGATVVRAKTRLITSCKGGYSGSNTDSMTSVTIGGFVGSSGAETTTASITFDVTGAITGQNKSESAIVHWTVEEEY